MTAFVAVFTQWNVSVGMGAALYTGLDYAGAKAGLEAEGFVITPELWKGIRIMEAEARKVLNRSAAG